MAEKNPHWSDTVNVTLEQCVFLRFVIARYRGQYLPQKEFQGPYYKKHCEMNLMEFLKVTAWGATHIRCRSRVRNFPSSYESTREKRDHSNRISFSCVILLDYMRMWMQPLDHRSSSSWWPVSLSPIQTSILPEQRCHGPPLLTHLLLILENSKWSLSSPLSV